MEIRIESIITGLEGYHQRLGDYYFALKERFHDTRIIKLLDYLGRCEKYMGNSVLTIKRNVKAEILNYNIHLSDSEEINTLMNYTIESAGDQSETYYDLLGIALKNDIKQKKICKTLSKSIDDPSVKRLLSSLCRVVDREIRNLYSYNNLFAS